MCVAVHSVCCSVLQCVAVCCSVLQCVAVTTADIDNAPRWMRLSIELVENYVLCVAGCCSVLQCVLKCVCTYIYSCAHVCIFVCMYVRTYMFVHVCGYFIVFAYIEDARYVCMCVCVCMHVYIYASKTAIEHTIDHRCSSNCSIIFVNRKEEGPSKDYQVYYRLSMLEHVLAHICKN